MAVGLNGGELWILLKFGPVSVSDVKFGWEIKTSPKMVNGSKFVFSHFGAGIVGEQIKISKMGNSLE